MMTATEDTVRRRAWNPSGLPRISPTTLRISAGALVEAYVGEFIIAVGQRSAILHPVSAGGDDGVQQMAALMVDL
jgi:hypothetical protein